MDRSLRVLLIDDDPDACGLLADGVTELGHRPLPYTRPEDALAALEANDVDVVITDVRMPRIDGVELCRRVAGNRPDIPVVVLTAFADMDTAVEALRAGAFDMLTKPWDLEELDAVIRRTARSRCAREGVRRLGPGEGSVPHSLVLEEIVAESESMRGVIDRISRAAGSDAPVLVMGESGVGKELVARALHRLGHRQQGPFVPVNCAAIPEELIESELFGHVRGAFTDATTDRKGLFLQADGGTLLLDEIDALPLALQAKLLRAVQERLVRPVGSDTELRFDTRIVTATNRDLEQLARTGDFREDLLYRLDVVRIELPPLRERREDVQVLAERFVSEFAHRMGKDVHAISDEALERLRRYFWPGNVRELRHCIESAVTLTRRHVVGVEDLPAEVRRFRGPATPSIRGDVPSLEEVELRHIQRVLRAVDGNKVEAAKLLGISRATLYRKLQKTDDATGS